MLEHSGGLLIKQYRGVDHRQTQIQHFLDGYPNLGSGLLTFAPIKYQLPRLECAQQISCGSLDFIPVRPESERVL
jgi:hypothetical protein